MNRIADIVTVRSTGPGREVPLQARGTTVISPPVHMAAGVRSISLRYGLGDDASAQREHEWRMAEAERRERRLEAQLSYAREDYRERIAMSREDRSDAQRADRELRAAQRWEQAQASAFDAARAATEAAQRGTGAILDAGRSNLTKIALVAGAGLLASYVLFSKATKRKPAHGAQGA